MQIDFNHALFWYANKLLAAGIHLSRENEEIKDYRKWLDEMRQLRNNVHLTAVEGTVAESGDYQCLDTVAWAYDCLHVTVEALKMYVKEESR